VRERDKMFVFESERECVCVFVCVKVCVKERERKVCVVLYVWEGEKVCV
jgi:hypothetical protein